MGDEIFAKVIFQFGSLQITDTILTTWLIIVSLFVISFWVARGVTLKPGKFQIIVEGIIFAAESAVRELLPRHYKEVLPFILGLWSFIVLANLIGLVPGLHSPTRDLSITAALAIIVLFSVHWFGIRIQGIKKYLNHYLRPSPILLPFHILSEVTRTMALAIRLFGNMMSLELVSIILLFVAGFLAPVPILMLHVIEALVQAYIFGMLALIYIASAIQTQELRNSKGDV